METEGTHTRGWFKSGFDKQIEKMMPWAEWGTNRYWENSSFLASNDSFWITGERVTASGGLH